MSEPELNNWGLIRLLTWKNWIVFRERRASFFFSISSPAIFLTILIFLRFSLDIENKDFKTYERINLTKEWTTLIDRFETDAEILNNKTNGASNHSCFIPQRILAYTAFNGTSALNASLTEEVMKSVSESLNIEVKDFTSSDTLREKMKKDHYLAGVDFTECNNKRINYTLIFPREVRFYSDNIVGSTWRTNCVYDPYYRNMERFPDANDGGYVGYVREGFLAIQHAIFLAFTNNNTIFYEPNIWMQRFPLPAFVIDPLLERMQLCLSLTILVGFLYPTIDLVKNIVMEKNLRLKDALNVFTISETVQYTAWIIRGLVPFSIASIISVTLLTINWSDGQGSFGNSSWTAIMYFMLTYNLTSISFSYLISTFCHRRTTAMTLQSLAWIFTYFPYAVLIYKLNNDTLTTFIMYIMVFLFSNTAMALGVNQMLDFEKFGEGFHWASLLETNNFEEENITVGAVTLILMGQALVYTLIGILIEKKIIRCSAFISCFNPKRLYLWLTNNSKAKPQRETGSTSSTDSKRKHSSDNAKLRKSSSSGKARMETQVIEIAASNKALLVEIKNLCKTRSDNVKIIDNVSMDLYEGEITVLMGANGSGKSLLMSMIVGRISATSGTVSINGIDLKHYDDLDHSSVGISLNVDMLFPDLTVSEQITFFCRLRGYSGKQLQSNVAKYLKAMNLTYKFNWKTRALTRGVKRHLCACCALCGHSKFVIIDELSTDMDVSARKLLWDLLLKEKKNRTILISTQSTEEAEVIADRIGIMSKGKLKCFGSIYFLKSFYGAGKRLTCTTRDDCNVDAVTEFINQYIPDIKPHCNIGTELSYIIAQDNIEVLESVLSAIENNRKKLKLHSITIAELPFEDIFLSMNEYDAEVSERKRLSRLMSGLTIYVEEYKSLYFLQRDKNKQSTNSQLYAMFLKRWYYFKRNPLLIVLEIGLPVLISCLSFFIYSSKTRESLPNINFQLHQYAKSVTVAKLEGHDQSVVRTAKKYYQYTEEMGLVHSYEKVENTRITDFILNKAKSEGSKYLVGATFSKDYIIAWFNNYPLHTAPLSLNMAHNALLKSYRRISVSFHPLDYCTEFDPDRMLSHVTLLSMLSFFFAFVMCCTYAIGILNVIDERVSSFKLLQYINGLKPTAYLIEKWSYDVVKVVIIGLLFDIIIAVQNIFLHNMHDMMPLVHFSIVLFLFAFGISNFIYCLAIFFNDPFTGYIVVLMINAYGAVLFVSLTEVHGEKFTHTINIADTYLWLFQMFPIFSYCSSMNKIAGAIVLQRVCDYKEIRRMSVLNNCTVNPKCCKEYTPNVLKWGNTYSIIPEMICLLSIGVICMVILCRIENDPNLRVSSIFTQSSNNESSIVSHLSHGSQNVVEMNKMAEQQKEIVRKLSSSQYKKKSLVMQNVSKSFDTGIALDEIYLQIDPGECFGLLGANNSGKGTIIKLLTGHENMTTGEIYVNGIRMNTELYKMYTECGLCPRSNVLPATFQVYEIMKIMCILRGIPTRSVRETCVNLAKVLGFFDNLFELYGKLSSGNKLRVCAALSMIGSPSIVYFNVITPGIDPAGRRQLWNIISRMCKMGKSVVIATVDTSECARICTRLAIVEYGTFYCVDTPHNFSKKYMKGYLLYVQIKPKNILKSTTSLLSYSHLNLEVAGSSKPDPFLKVSSFVEQTFKNAIVQDQRGHMIIFFIPGHEISMADIYMAMKRNAFNLNVETFSLTRHTLEMVFIDLVEGNARPGSIF